MRTIASLTGPDFLRACNRTRYAAAAFLRETGVAEIRKILPKDLPTIPENAPDDQRAKLEAERAVMLEKQGRKNFSAMLDRMLEEKPEATYRLLKSLLILERDKDGNEIEPDGFDLIDAGLEILTSPKMLDFFGKLEQLAPTIMGG